MALIKIVTWPHPVLKRVGDPVTVFDDSLRKLVSDMFETMYAAPGVGLAAPQVGISKRLFVMDCSHRRGPSRPLVVANPEIVFTSGEQSDDEGCLSVPGYSSKLKRPMNVVVRGQDLNGKEFEYHATELEARCVLHETDHCDGILYLRRLSPVKRQEILSSIKKKIKAQDWPVLQF